jgi:hypothetical protein
MTQGGEDGEESGSDSAPSEDNLSEDELAQIVPIAKKKEEPEPPKPVAPKAKKAPEPVKVDKEEQKAASAQNKARPVIKQQLPV